MWELYEKLQGDGQITIAQLAPGDGTADQVIALKDDASEFEFRTISSDDPMVVITQTTGVVTFSPNQGIVMARASLRI